jgi:hypothetical protein
MVGILKRATGTSGLPNQFDTGFHFFIQIGIKPWRGSYVFLEEIKIVLHCLARLFKTLRHHFTQGKGVSLPAMVIS